MGRRSSSKQAWAAGGLVFASTVLIVLGIWQVVVGIAAILDDQFFVVGADYTYNLDTTAWGWIHLALGVLTGLAGLYLLTGAAWARGVAIAFAALSAINNFIFLPHYPLWSLTVIALDVWVIWSLATVDTRGRAGWAPGMALGGYGGGERTPERWPANRPTRAGEPARPTAPEAMPTVPQEAQPRGPNPAG